MSDRFHFLKLTPTADTTLDVYADAMKYVFDNDDIRNIAISGSYGAGKSSMMETYEKEHQEKKFLHISLAHFTEQEGLSESAKGGENEQGQDEGKRKRDSLETVLEGKILNQLLHQIDPDGISQTDFRIKKDISRTDKKEITRLTWGAVLFLLCVCFLCFNAAWCDMVSGFTMPFLRALFWFTTTREAEFVIGIAAVVILFFAVKNLLTIQRNRKIFKKLNFQGNEIEIFSDSQDSYFDKYLNEVLYLFEHANVSGIVFEDIDRYESKLIFEKLREVNFLLNKRVQNKRVTEKQEPVRFFYLMRDEIFQSKDRVKFFDFIIPIVPVVNAGNAYDKLTQYFEEGGLLSLFDKGFLKNIALYIDDMRLLMNVYNEFVIYHDKMNKVPSGLNSNKLLAMLLYKNIYPEDFGKLQNKQGYVYALFDNEEVIRQARLDGLQEKLKECREKEEEIQEEVCRDIEELNAIYFLPDGKISVDGKKEEDFASRKEFVKAAMHSQSQRIYDFDYRSWVDYDIAPAIKKMEENPEYIKRKDAISGNTSKKIKREKTRLNAEIERVKTAHLKDLINRENSKEIFSRSFKNALNEEEKFENIKRNSYFPLIRYLISEGYIDETYPDYMSYFYENNITRTDKEFLRSITDKEAKPYDYAIKNPREVVESIRLADFEEEEIFNVDLLDYLLEHDLVYREQLKQFMRGVWNYEPEEFVIQYLGTGKNKSEFINEFNKYWVGACGWILTEETIPEEVKKQYITGTLCASTKEVIEKNNIDNVITEYIENRSDFLQIEQKYVEALKAGLEKVNVRFRHIDYEHSDKQLFDFVYRNQMFALTVEMVDEILRCIYGIKNPENRREKHISLILSRPQETLCVYVKENIADYLHTLLGKIEKSFDSEETLLFLLNHENIADEDKKHLIRIQERQIANLIDVEERELWPFLLEGEKVFPDNANIADYFFLSGNGLDERLTVYINSFENEVSFKPELLTKEYGETAVQDLFNAVLSCNGLRDDMYENILHSLGLTCKNFDNKELEVNKVKILVKCGIISMEAKQLQFMRNTYADLCPFYILHNIDTYTSIIENDIRMFSPEECKMICEYPEVSDDTKLALLKRERKPISIQDTNYSDKLQQYILKSNYSQGDLQYLVERYADMAAVVKAEIYRIAVEEIEEVISLKVKVPAPLFNKLMKESSIPITDRQSLLAVQCNLGMWQERVKSALKDLELLEFLELFEGRNIRVEDTAENELLLQAFQNRKWILNYETDDTDYNYLKVSGCKKGRNGKNKSLIDAL